MRTAQAIAKKCGVDPAAVQDSLQQQCGDADASLDEMVNRTSTNGMEEESIGIDSRSMTLGIQMVVLMHHLLKNVLAYINGSGLKISESNISTSTATPYIHAVDEFLRCISMVYLGQEGTIPERYGEVRTSRLGYPDTSTDRWEPSLSHIFQSLILETMGQGTERQPISSIIQMRLVENESMLHLLCAHTPPMDGCNSIHFKREEEEDFNSNNDCDDPCKCCYLMPET